MNYTPTESQIAATKRADEERKKLCEIILERHRVKDKEKKEGYNKRKTKK